MLIVVTIITSVHYCFAVLRVVFINFYPFFLLLKMVHIRSSIVRSYQQGMP